MDYHVIIIGGGAAGISAALWCDELRLKTLLLEAGSELGLAACAVIEKLGLAKTKVPIGCVGSVFKAGKLLTEPICILVNIFRM